jgi:hypothetical protein
LKVFSRKSEPLKFFFSKFFPENWRPTQGAIAPEADVQAQQGGQGVDDPVALLKEPSPSTFHFGDACKNLYLGFCFDEEDDVSYDDDRVERVQE